MLITKKQLRARIAELEAEVERLRPLAEKHVSDSQRKRALEKKQRGLLPFFNYKNYRDVDKRHWPDVLCYQCNHCVEKKSPSGGKTKWRCKAVGPYVAKFSSCDLATSKKGRGLKEKSA